MVGSLYGEDGEIAEEKEEAGIGRNTLYKIEQINKAIEENRNKKLESG